MFMIRYGLLRVGIPHSQFLSESRGVDKTPNNQICQSDDIEGNSIFRTVPEVSVDPLAEHREYGKSWPFV